jgi:hypothetical protein
MSRDVCEGGGSLPEVCYRVLLLLFAKSFPADARCRTVVH